MHCFLNLTQLIIAYIILKYILKNILYVKKLLYKKGELEMRQSTKDLSITGLLIALVCVATMMISIPITANGYVHLGDSVILFAGVVFGKKKGMLAGGIGSAMADILLGYTHWAPFTLIIKGLMGYVAGVIGNSNEQGNNFIKSNRIIAGVVSELVMIVGYFLAGIFLSGGVLASLASVSANFVQAGMGFVLFIVIGVAFFKTGLQSNINTEAVMIEVESNNNN